MGTVSSDLAVERLGLTTNSGVPRYRQIADQLAVLISDAAPGSRLPSEHDIARHLEVSRATAVQALRELESRGLVNRRQGRGSFVADTSRAIRSTGMGFVPSFSQDLREAGHQTSEQILVCERLAVADDVIVGLELSSDTEAWCVRRVILSDSEPAIHVTSWLPIGLYPRLDRSGIESGSLYEYLESHYGPHGRPSAAEEEWTAQGVDRDVARILDLRTGSPVMRVQRRAFLADGTPAEYAVSLVRAEIFMVSVRVASDDRPGIPTTRVRASVR